MTDKRVVDFLRTALRKLNQDWPRSVNLRTPLWSRLTVFCHPSRFTLVSPVLYLCTICVVVRDGRTPGGLKVILYFRPTRWLRCFFMKTLSGVFLGSLKVLLPLSVCRSTNRLISLSLFEFPYHVPCSCVEQLQSGFVKSRKINITLINDWQTSCRILENSFEKA